tara:strand:+ start:1858 stop:2319 length:462 start_codon:yes stop_codon:yes gene_type:complete
MNKRFIGKLKDASLLEKNEEGFTKCRWCNGSVLPPRRTMCSPECVHELKLRSNGNYLRNQVYKRDKGICSVCEINTKETSKTAKSILDIDKRNEFLLSKGISIKRKIWKQKHGGGLWDADHIICVKDGGGQCGLENLRTLCIECHKKKTYNKL